MYYPHYKNGIRYTLTFTLQCPNQGHQLTLSLLHDATVRSDIHFYDVCTVAGGKVTIAFELELDNFEVDNETQTIKEFPVGPVDGWYSQIPWEFEIINPFLDHYSLTPTWIYCEEISGIFDDETGAWTGAVGKVRI